MNPQSIPYQLYLTRRELGQLSTEVNHPEIDESIQDISNTIHKIKSLFDRLLMKKSAIRVIASLKESKVDYTLLLYLQIPPKMRKEREFISCLEAICVKNGVDYNSRLFYDYIWSHFEKEGVLPITLDKFITGNRKEEILKEYERVKKSWGRHNPLFLQTYTTEEGKFTNNLYHISRTVQDGILRLMDILKAGEFVVNGRVYAATGAFEHVISPLTLICPIYDCEIMSSMLKSLKTTEEIKEMVQCLPACISDLMISTNLIDIETFITFTVKDRTRWVKDRDVKISFHFIPNICAPKAVHNKAAELYLRECKGRIDEAAAAMKKTGTLPESFLTNGIRDSLLTLDYSAMKSNPFTTAFSRKNPSDPFSLLVYAEEVCGGFAVSREECTIQPQDLEGTNLTDKERHMLVFRQLYTAPKHEMLCFTESAMETLSQEPEKVFFNLLPALGFEPIHPLVTL
jgi:hypothetical protein